MISYYLSEKYMDSREKIKKAFNFTDCSFDKVPLVIQTANMTATGQDYNVFPEDYFDNPRSMLEFQESSFKNHLDNIEDDYIPYLCPWYGVCVVPDYFGSKIIFPKNGDPAAFPVIKTVEEAKNLKIKDFEESDLMNRVINTINYFKENSSYPISVTDSQGTLNCITQIIGYQNLFYWMKDDPGLVNYLLDLVNNTIRNWTIFQKKLIGERIDNSNGVISIKPPNGIGAWFSDDDMTILSPDLYGSFIVEKHSGLFKNFGGTILHWCGDGIHNLESVVSIQNLKAVHNFFLGKIEDAVKLQKKLKKYSIALIAGDIVPVKEQLNKYLVSIKQNLDPVGLILNFWIYPRIGLKDGRYVDTKNDQIEMALRIIDFFKG